jgi:hypothetical protein
MRAANGRGWVVHWSADSRPVRAPYFLVFTLPMSSPWSPFAINLFIYWQLVAVFPFTAEGADGGGVGGPKGPSSKARSS